MERIYYDLETLPATDEKVVAHIRANLKPPGNMSSPVTIKKWLEDPANAEKAVRKTALDGSLGQILCIGYAIGDEGEVKVIEGGPDKEADCIEEFLEVVREGEFENKHMLVGHANQSFDNKFLSQRMMIKGFGPLFSHKTKPWDTKSEDTMQMFCGGGSHDYMKLETLCLALGIPTPKEGMDGSMVYDAWLNGEIGRIMTYCSKDVDRTRRVHQAITRRAA